MKLTNTPEQIKTLAATLSAARRIIEASLFECKSCDPVYNAQRNLEGRTHYVDSNTLKWHKCRVLSSRVLADGLLFRITTSDALDMNNTKRGFRVVVFDVFGDTVYRPDLEHASKTRKVAEKAAALQSLAAFEEARELAADIVTRILRTL